jgi:arylsulfatase B
VLVVLLDDVGVDQLASYGATDAAPTPTLDCLCQRGVRFSRAWGAPLCSPGRAALMTGRQADKTGIGYNLGRRHELPLSEVTLGEVLQASGRRTALLGKWHLSSWSGEQGMEGPRLQGFEVFRGTLANLDVAAQQGERRGDFWGYWRVVDGQARWTERYATTVTVDDALDFISETPEPWGMVLALHAPHEPLHEPPRRLLSAPLPREPSRPELYRAMLEAADTELGRLLRSMDPEVLAQTLVVVASDNGTSPEGTLQARDDRVKRTLFEGGIHVPLLFAGPGAQEGGTSEALVHLVDVLPTVAALVGEEVPAVLDGVSLVPQLQDPLARGPPHVSTQWNPHFEAPELAVRDDRYKLVRDPQGDRLYDLWWSPDERQDLLGQELTMESLRAWDRLSSVASGSGEPRDGGLRDGL